MISSTEGPPAGSRTAFALGRSATALALGAVAGAAWSTSEFSASSSSTAASYAPSSGPTSWRISSRRARTSASSSSTETPASSSVFRMSGDWTASASSAAKSASEFFPGGVPYRRPPLTLDRMRLASAAQIDKLRTGAACFSPRDRCPPTPIPSELRGRPFTVPSMGFRGVASKELFCCPTVRMLDNLDSASQRRRLALVLCLGSKGMALTRTHAHRTVNRGCPSPPPSLAGSTFLSGARPGPLARVSERSGANRLAKEKRCLRRSPAKRLEPMPK